MVVVLQKIWFRKAPTCMRSIIRLGKVFGIKIGLHFSWFLIALLIAFSLSEQFRAVNPAWSAALVVTLAIATAIGSGGQQYDYGTTGTIGTNLIDVVP